MTDILLKPFRKIRNDVRRQIAWSRMTEVERHIIQAERDMIRAHARWQSLLAARDADERARADIKVMINEEYGRLGFKKIEA